MDGPMPAWVRRRQAQQDAERAARWQRRVTALIGDLLPVDALWSNATLQAFCLDCMVSAPPPLIEMGLPPDTVCSCCGQQVGAVAARKVG